MQSEVEHRLVALDDGVVRDLPIDLDLDQLIAGYRVIKPDTSVDDLTMACIEYAIRCTYPELFGEPEAPKSPKEAKEPEPAQEVD